MSEEFNTDSVEQSPPEGEAALTEVPDEDGFFLPELAADGKKSGIFNYVLEGLDVLVSAMIAVVVLFVFVFKVPTIEGPSMNDTLFNGERVIISNVNYEPKYGDIVVISRNDTNDASKGNSGAMPIIKRVIATEGQKVGIDFEKGIVYVDGKALDEPYTKTPTNHKYDLDFSVDNPVTVPENCVFVLGDNRNNSLDSRSAGIGNSGNGMIDKRYVLGKALIRIFPINRFGKIE